jgi:IPT/TIG domain-containing protein
MSDRGYYDESYPPSLWTIPDPSITTLTPATAVAGSGPFTVTVTGTNFIQGSQIEIDQVGVPTAYVSATSLTTSYSPSAPGTHQFTVRNGGAGGEESNARTFTVT